MYPAKSILFPEKSFCIPKNVFVSQKQFSCISQKSFPSRNVVSPKKHFVHPKKVTPAMIAEREALRMGIEHLTVLFPTEVSSFDFQVECTDWTVQYKLNAQSLRLFGLHRDVNDAHRAGANRLQNKTKQTAPVGSRLELDRMRNSGRQACKEAAPEAEVQ